MFRAGTFPRDGRGRGGATQPARVLNPSLRIKPRAHGSWRPRHRTPGTARAWRGGRSRETEQCRSMHQVKRYAGPAGADSKVEGPADVVPHLVADIRHSVEQVAPINHLINPKFSVHEARARLAGVELPQPETVRVYEADAHQQMTNRLNP